MPKRSSPNPVNRRLPAGTGGGEVCDGVSEQAFQKAFGSGQVPVPDQQEEHMAPMGPNGDPLSGA